jgi:hypothetical protein
MRPSRQPAADPAGAEEAFRGIGQDLAFSGFSAGFYRKTLAIWRRRVYYKFWRFLFERTRTYHDSSWKAKEFGGVPVYGQHGRENFRQSGKNHF